MPNRSSFVRIVALLGAATIVACASSNVTEPQTPRAALTSLPRDLSPAERSVLSASNTFSFALWQRINAAQRDSNVFVSPLSASFALGMTLNGASAGTFEEMRTGLQLGTASLADIDAGYKSLITLLTALDPSVTMNIANSIWYRNTFAFNQAFLDDGANYFNAAIKPLNFSDVAGSVATINGWVSTATNGKIPTILDTITPENVMFLINAIYFKGTWRERFDPAQTQDAQFHGATGDQPARLMHRTGRISYGETATYQAVDLPYGDSAFTMTVVLPKPGNNVETIAASLDPQSWGAMASGLHVAQVDLSLPKVTMSWKRGLIPDLQALGMHLPFTDAADFTRMSPAGHSLVISQVTQKTFVAIDEQGTEAAAVTVGGISVTSAPLLQIMHVDRPFIFVIRERLSGTVLFMGKIVRLP